MLKKTLGALLTVACLFLPAMAQQNGAAEQPQSFDERLGPDDGAVLAILFGANMRGNLDLCDCNHPRGGLARRIGYLEGFKKKFKSTPVIHVEAGFFWYNSTGYPKAVMLQNEQVARAYSRWPFDVINLSRYDLIYAQKLLASDGFGERVVALPMMEKLVSANGVFGPDVVAPAPYLIKEVTAPRLKGRRKIRVGFIGLAEPLRTSGGLMDGTVKDMFKAAREVVPQARKKSDILVILSHSEMDAAMRLAQENPEVDVIVVGNAEGLFKPRQVGNTYIVSAAPGNTQEGDLRVYVDAAGKFSYKFRSTNLDATVPTDPAADQYTKAALQELRKLQQGVR
ncbi:MAG TPA: hypothetical protein VNO70_05295 [Blastocatellia bacterium]|nr:hypothetical protein [Blastocatellia bacterium]